MGMVGVYDGSSDAELGGGGLPRPDVCRGTIAMLVEVLLLIVIESRICYPPPDGCGFGACGA